MPVMRQAMMMRSPACIPVASATDPDATLPTTGGNFGTSTIANEFYRVYFVQSRSGFGSALAVLIFILVVPVVVINRRAQARAEEMMAA